MRIQSCREQRIPLSPELLAQGCTKVFPAGAIMMSACAIGVKTGFYIGVIRVL